MTSFTLAHFSDLHLAPLVGFQMRYWNTKRAIGFLNWQRKRKRLHDPEIAKTLLNDARALGVDHIAITGDLVNLGLPQEHEAALAWLKTIDTEQRITVIPGNHDIYSSMHGDRGISRWAPYMGHEPETLAFPFVRRFNNIALIGLNSAIETKPFVAAGRLGREQVAALSDILQRLRDEDVIRVVLIHHPPLPGMASASRALEDAHHLQHVLTKHGAELVLYGHNHISQFDRISVPDAPAIAINGVASGSAADATGRHELASYALFAIFKSDAGIRLRRTLRGLAPGGKSVVQLSEDMITL
jgi:3',5'-cyclic AMP phosphodiesterase CpdA